MADLKSIKQRFGIIGTSPLLDRALSKAVQVAPTDISVLVTGESGVGKESIPKIIHNLSHRKHKPYIAVNCGAIPEGTIDSELFGHEKGAFTGATGARKGYFEEADGGTIFLDEVGELPCRRRFDCFACSRPVNLFAWVPLVPRRLMCAWWVLPTWACSKRLRKASFARTSTTD